ncbi:MAG TPA: hypothetical protein VNV88_02365 [Candidatus Solibacter sp.]|jgi:hypothetical protein|nr:hypothetical protein [Candidatus Solibacter sp.]
MLSQAVTHEAEITTAFTPKLWLPALVFLATLASWPQVPASTAETKSPDLNLILQRLEDVQHQDPSQSRPYEVTREYKAFRGDDRLPTSEVMAQINFVPPDTKTYKITKARGNSRGEKIVRELLDRETESAKKGRGSEITRTNYDFVFLRQENFGVPEYVLRIVPKRKDKYLLRGQIWVDASTFHIRRIEGIPARSPSFWIKDIHITLQYAALGGMWVPVSFDAIATVRLLGQYTLAGLNIPGPDPFSTVPKP